MSEAPRHVRFLVTGRVQGVGFRAFAQRAAAALGLAGFVRNRVDGGVEGEAEGAARDVAALLRRLEQGPAFAAVANVEVDELPAGVCPPGFEVRR